MCGVEPDPWEGGMNMPRSRGTVRRRFIFLCRSPRVARDVDPYGFVGGVHNLFREIPLRALPMVGFDFADNT